MSYFDDYNYDNENEQAPFDGVEDSILWNKEMEFNDKQEAIKRDAINASHLLFIKENKKALCGFHKMAVHWARNKKDRDLFACHLGLYCVANYIECFGQERGEIMGTLPFGKTVKYESSEERVRIIKTLLSLLVQNESLKAVPDIIHCPKARHIGDILDWAITPSPAWSDEEFWALFE